MKLRIFRILCNVVTALMFFIAAKLTSFDVAIIIGISLILNHQIFDNAKE